MFNTAKDDCQEDKCCAAEEAGRKVRVLINNAAHDARDVAALTEKQIRQNPVKAAAIAGAVGLLVGMLFRRR